MLKSASTDRPTLARQYRALADERRLHIIALLHSGERCVCDLNSALDITQPLLSFHLRTLRDAGIVSDRREGRWVYYTLVPGVLEDMNDMLMTPADEADFRGMSDRCCG
jgi:ArsR family transcriptional regulator